MISKLKYIGLIISAIRLIPHVILLKTSKNRKVIEYDINRWLEITKREKKLGFVRLMTYLPEFRNLFYKRIGSFSALIRWLCPQMNTLFINTDDIGPGLFIRHGFATIIAAKSIGKDCWIYQQVTIGYSSAENPPTIGDNVVINAGAMIIGDIHMGNNSRAGANAVVVKDVPDGCTVVSGPTYIIRRNGVRVHEKL